MPVDLDVDEQVHRTVEEFFAEFLAGLLADPFQGLAALAQDDRALALALDIDGLLDAGRAVLAFLEGRVRDCRGRRQLLVDPQVEFSRVISAASRRAGMSAVCSADRTRAFISAARRFLRSLTPLPSAAEIMMTSE